jgi:hypothetical protein
MVNLDRRKVFIICGLFITLVVLALPFVLKKRPLIVKASRYIYLKRKEGYQLILYFDRQGKLWELVARFNSPSGTIGGIKFGASEREIDAKLGKPISISRTASDEMWCFYAKKGGYMGVHFWKDDADAVVFVQDNPELTSGIRMGMGKEEVMKMLGAPDAIEEARGRKGFPLLAFLIIVALSFWGTYLSSILPRFRFKFGWFLALILNSILFGILWFAFIVFYIRVERYLAHTEFSLYPPILVEIPKWATNLPPLGVMFFIVGLPLGAMATFLIYAKHLRRKRFLYLFSLIVLIPLMGYLLSLAVDFVSSFTPSPSSFLFRKAWTIFPVCLLSCLFVVGWHYSLSKEGEESAKSG